MLLCAVVLARAWQQEGSAKWVADSSSNGGTRRAPLATAETGGTVRPPVAIAIARPGADSAFEYFAVEPGRPLGSGVEGSPARVPLPSATGAAAPEIAPELIVTDAGAPKLDPALLIARGDEYFARSDVVSARLLYKRAADGGSGAAAAAMAATFDPIVLERRSVRGVLPDPKVALEWYRKAAEMGDAVGNASTEALLGRLQSAAAQGDAQARAILDAALR